MVQKKALVLLGPFVIGLLFIELGLFCYSFYDPTIRFSPDWFPLRGWAYLLLPFGVTALIIGTIYLIGTNEEEKE
ncbi:MAG: hypothetical protein JSV05_02995 [Candidatus Bathyarchaeota archaeon]|nr:MAG: hypothetical protein JSV05_02995 [Candidatus Bathyarchaeota archaeon]